MSLAVALGGHVLDKGAVVWYAAVGFVDDDRNAARVLARRAQVVTRRICQSDYTVRRLGFLAVVRVETDCRAVCTCADEVNP